MMSLNQSLMNLITQRSITFENALEVSHDPEELTKMLAAFERKVG